MMRRGFLAVLLALGATFGFASGIHHLRHGEGHGGWHEQWHEQESCEGRQGFERHVAEICADAAVRAHGPASAPAP